MSENENTLSLAPAAGSGMGKIVAAELLTLDAPKKVAAALNRGLTAERSVWISEGKGQGHWQSEPDTRSQLQAAALILAHMEGEPVKRVIHQHIGANGALDLGAALRESPELVALVERELDKANWRKSGRNGKAKPVTPAESV